MIDASKIQTIDLTTVKLQNIEFVDMFVAQVANTDATRVLISSFGFSGPTTKELPMDRFKALSGFLRDFDKKMIVDVYIDFETQQKTVWIVLSENKNKVAALKSWLNNNFGLEREEDKDDCIRIL